MSEHSPGSWKRCMASDGRCRCGLVWDAPYQFVVAHVVASDEDHDKPNDMFQANCRLIAAAPTTLQERDELLEALREATAEAVDLVAFFHGECHDNTVAESACTDETCMGSMARIDGWRALVARIEGDPKP